DAIEVCFTENVVVVCCCTGRDQPQEVTNVNVIHEVCSVFVSSGILCSFPSGRSNLTAQAIAHRIFAATFTRTFVSGLLLSIWTCRTARSFRPSKTSTK